MEEGAKYLRGDEPPDLDVIMRRETDDIRCGGPALVASLLKGLLDRGVAIETGTAALDLVVVDGEVVGVLVEHDDATELIGAPTRVSCSHAAGSSGTTTWCAPSSAARCSR